MSEYCRNCKTVESAGGDDNVKLCDVHAALTARLQRAEAAILGCEPTIADEYHYGCVLCGHQWDIGDRTERHAADCIYAKLASKK